MRTTAEQLNQELSGFTDVGELRLAIDLDGKYELQMTLSNGDGRSILLRCDDISNLKIKEFGGGLVQFLTLRCTDVQAKQLDRVRLHFVDLERGGICFNCSDATLTIVS